ncbi:uncharacterized protein DSM5745_08644 [Aspergillus mulundensis]|uniref:BTB domain-containing protein n=1 Tax=Aspergillus mulundensis TaxID=1810919 RepID=A0A3D8R4Z6_9EURO|nr:hypothetical protein DSM5745_08644 [Aspergillus mulundensis]RDW68884.1 hypothetical protein DSM5745_08644 [Aspergillus mulundensis]
MSEPAAVPYSSFLESETVVLKASESGRHLRIHRGLLNLKGGHILHAFEAALGGEKCEICVFQTTSESTLVRFIEWAYTGDYPAKISPRRAGPRAPQQDCDESKEPCVHIQQLAMIIDPDTDESLANHSLLAHVHLYIFARAYAIPGLRRLALEKAMATLRDLDQPITLRDRLAVMAALHASSTKLLRNDPFLEWIAQYAAYNIEHLRALGAFELLLVKRPQLGASIFWKILAGGQAPWQGVPSTDGSA